MMMGNWSPVMSRSGPDSIHKYYEIYNAVTSRCPHLHYQYPIIYIARPRVNILAGVADIVPITFLPPPIRQTDQQDTNVRVCGEWGIAGFQRRTCGGLGGTMYFSSWGGSW